MLSSVSTVPESIYRLEIRVRRGSTRCAGSSIRRRRPLAYLHAPELDMAAHARGWLSDKWIGELERLDSELERLAQALPASAGIIVTADHGVIDVPAAKHVLFDTAPQPSSRAYATSGETRGACTCT